MLKKKAFLTENVSSIIQCKTPPKFKDPSYPTISCIIENYIIDKALLDLGASVLQLGLREIKPTNITL